MYSGEKISDFRTRFNELFEERKTTNTELGKELHVSNQTISAWKLGERSPKLPTVLTIASYFGVNIQWLLGYDVKKEDEDSGRKISIVVPDSERFVKLVHYMPSDDYVMVMKAFERAEKRMKEAEGETE